ncbi:Glycosyl transferases group 1 [Neomoorella glycerini]|uniref:Glycosyl transferases group 1 n=1 Tax=Neomoorella glycerini TaxID=55779 RepID=A0A6I5ZRP4_9FIRM|nr:glycosyltransferase family 4 protein [Moorella glycerini]QGP92683.1 Glycosyl transferases group 1 [Moorella glycerini]
MNILFLTSTYPYPPHSGYQLRCYHFIRQLAERHEIYLISFTRKMPKQSDLQAMQRLVTDQWIVEGAYSSVSKALIGLFKPVPFHVFSHQSREFARALSNICAKTRFDVIYSNFIYFTPYVRQFASPMTLKVLDQHNVDRDVWQKMARYEASFPRRMYSLLNLLKTKRFEKQSYPLYDLVISVSADDARITREISPGSHVVEVASGVDCAEYKPPSRVLRDPYTILFTGSGASRNLEAIRNFARNIFPNVRRAYPAAKFQVVGNINPAELKVERTLPGFEFVGKVENIKPYFWNASIFVAPFKLGGGAKLKIFEAMAAGLPVVGTPTGCQGIDGAEDGKHFLIAQSDDDFTAKVIGLLRDIELRKSIARNGMRLVQERYDWRYLVSKLDGELEEAYLKKVHIK